MKWQLILGVFAGVVQIIATVPYLISIVRGSTRPNLISWILWTVTVSITLVAQISAGASGSIFLLIGATICNLAVVFLCIKGYGYKKFGKIDVVTLILAIVAIIGWLVSSNPLIAIIFAVAADCIAYAPTIAKMYRYPATEQAVYWGLLVIADIFALISVTAITLPNIIFPIAYGIMNGVGFFILVLSFFKLHKNRPV